MADERDTQVRRSARAAGADGVASKSRGLRVGLLVAGVLVLGGLGVKKWVGFEYPIDPATKAKTRDADLCLTDPVGGGQGTAAFMFDARKPFDRVRTDLPGSVLREVGAQLPRDTEFLVYGSVAEESANVRLIARFCKPYGNSELEVASAKDGLGVRGCDNIPSQVPAQVRANASGFCALLERAASRLVQLAASAPPTTRKIERAPLVEALEDVELDLAGRSRPSRLFVLSDMIQHTQWFSHLDLGLGRWETSDFADVPATVEYYDARPEYSEFVGVEIFYVPRVGWTDRPKMRVAHKRFWDDYFRQETSLRVLPAMEGYDVLPVMGLLSRDEIVEQERAELASLVQVLRSEQAGLVEKQRTLERQQANMQRTERERIAAQEASERAALEAQREVARLVAARQAAAEAEAQRVRDALAVIDVDDENPSDDVQELTDPVPVSAPTRTCSLMAATNTKRDVSYPSGGRTDLGNARIMVEYDIDETGAVVSETVTVNKEESIVSRTRHWNRFAQEAMSAVRSWRYESTEGAGGEPCQMAQSHRSGVSFRWD